MPGMFFNACVAAATITVERPIDGQTGVWLKVGDTVISSGMSMAGVTVSDGQMMYIYASGVADSINVSSGGIVNISSGGAATSSLIYSSGTVSVSNGGTLSVVSTLEMAANVTVFSGATVSGAFVLLGNLLISSGGFAEDIVASGLAPTSRGILNLREGGSMNRVTCQRAENGYFNGNVAELTISGEGAVAYLRAPCVASGVSVVSGTLIVQSGASALAVTSNAGAVVTVVSGGYIEYITEPIDGSQGVFLRSDGATISSAMSMTNLTIGANTVLNIYSSGIVDSVVWQRSGEVYVSNGGTISSLDMSSQLAAAGDKLEVASGGYISAVSLLSANGRGMSGGGSVGGLTLQSASFSATDIQIGHLVQSTYGGLTASAGTIVSSADIYANHFRLSSGTTALAATVYAGGNMSVYVGASALNVVNSGGNIVNAGGHIEYA